jgi:hypothetical protein
LQASSSSTAAASPQPPAAASPAPPPSLPETPSPAALAAALRNGDSLFALLDQVLRAPEAFAEHSALGPLLRDACLKVGLVVTILLCNMFKDPAAVI